MIYEDGNSWAIKDDARRKAVAEWSAQVSRLSQKGVNVFGRVGHPEGNFGGVGMGCPHHCPENGWPK